MWQLCFPRGWLAPAPLFDGTAPPSCTKIFRGWVPKDPNLAMRIGRAERGFSTPKEIDVDCLLNLRLGMGTYYVPLLLNGRFANGGCGT